MYLPCHHGSPYWELLSDYYHEDWINSQWVASKISGGGRYYYEEFSLGIPTIKKGEIVANLFPVPANESLTIAIKWPTSQNFKGIIYNAEGKICAEWNGVAIDFYTKDLSVANFESGIYHLIINGEKDSWRSTFILQH